MHSRSRYQQHDQQDFEEEKQSARGEATSLPLSYSLSKTCLASQASPFATFASTWCGAVAATVARHLSEMLSLIIAFPERLKRPLSGGRPKRSRDDDDETDETASSCSGGSSILTSIRLTVLELRESVRKSFADRSALVAAAADR